MKDGVRIALLRAVIALSAMTTPWAAGIDFASTACETPSGLTHPLLDGDGELSHFVQLPEHCLKTMYLYCSSAPQTSLGRGLIMACSVGYEALLRRVFDGDFGALLAWRRSHGELTQPE
jgi:hypothetical protein